jgi:hypothetical protein
MKNSQSLLSELNSLIQKNTSFVSGAASGYTQFMLERNFGLKGEFMLCNDVTILEASRNYMSDFISCWNNRNKY